MYWAKDDRPWFTWCGLHWETGFWFTWLWFDTVRHTSPYHSDVRMFFCPSILKTSEFFIRLLTSAVHDFYDIEYEKAYWKKRKSIKWAAIEIISSIVSVGIWNTSHVGHSHLCEELKWIPDPNHTGQKSVISHVSLLSKSKVPILSQNSKIRAKILFR